MSFEELKEVFVDTLNCDADKVTMEASLTEDLQADSLDAVELNMAFEDAVAGVQAAHNAGMKAVGIGSPEILGQAELVIPGFANVTVNDMLQRLQNV